MSDVEKVYWTTSEVAEMLNSSTSAIRYWIKAFDLEKEIRKVRANYRQLNKKQVMKLIAIHHLLYVELYTIAGAKRILDSVKKTDKEMPDYLSEKASWVLKQQDYRSNLYKNSSNDSESNLPS